MKAFHKLKRYWRYISIIGVVLVFLLCGGILIFYERKETSSLLPSPEDPSEIVRIKILKSRGSGLAERVSLMSRGKKYEFYEINFVNGEYKEKNGVIIPKEYINQLKESLLDKVESQGFHSISIVTDVFLSETVEILWGNKKRTILRSNSVGVPWWNILEDGRIYFQNSGKIPYSLNKIIATIQGRKISKEIEELKPTEIPSDLGKGEIPPEIEKGYLGFIEFQSILWNAYLYPQPTFSIRFRNPMNLDIEKAVLNFNQKVYPLHIDSSQLTTTLKNITAKPGSKFKGEITIWYKKNGIKYVTDGIVNGFWQKDRLTSLLKLQQKNKPEIAYESERWVLDFKPVVKESSPTKERKVKITFQKPVGKIKKIILIDNCSFIAIADKEGGGFPCDIVSEDNQTITLLCDLKDIAGIHKPGEEVNLCLGIKVYNSLKTTRLKGVWLADFSESMDKYLKIHYDIMVSPNFELVKSNWRGNNLEVVLKSNKEIEILRVEKGFSNKKKIKAGEVFTLYIEDLEDSNFKDFDTTFYPQAGGTKFVFRDTKEKFAYLGTIFVLKYAIKK